MWPLMTCMKILILIISFYKIGIKTKNQKIFYKLKSQNKSNFMWPPMTSEDMLYSMKKLCLYNVNIYIKFWYVLKQIYWRKSEFINKKVFLCDHEWHWPLRSYFILWKMCVFLMLAFIDFVLKSVHKWMS